MLSLRPKVLGAVVLAVILAAGAVATAQSRSVGQVIDDVAITTEVKAKLTAEQLSNLTRIGVSTRDGIVTLTGEVDSLERQARAAQIAGGVKGVRGVVNDIQVTAAAVTPSPPPPTASVPDS